VSAIIYLEGGGADSQDLHTRCREGFRKLLQNAGFAGRMPRLVACGGRGATFEDFKTAHAAKRKNDYVAMLIDSEDPMADYEKPWEHLQKRKDDNWKKPEGAADDQVLLMTTCMETCIIADRTGLQAHYGSELQVSALPSVADLETRDRHAIQDALVHATRNCTNAYRKGKRSFEVLAELDSETLKKLLPSFARIIRILGTKL
jgi:hypothetical protein